MSSPIPVVVMGRAAAIATEVKANLMPDYEVIHVILSLETGLSQLPSVLRGETPPPNDAAELQVGTGNYSAPPVAVIVGAGWDDDSVEVVRKACAGASKVPWLRADMSIQRPPPGPGYGKYMVGRVTATLESLKAEGGSVGDKVVLY